jgi:Tol biopolymer transport system component
VKRLAIILGLSVLWASFGFGVYHLLESRKSNLTATLSVKTPTQEAPSFSLPGTIYVSQAGQLYRYAGGRFTSLNLPTADRSWMQPAAGPDGDLVAVARFSQWSDIYLVDGHGTVIGRLTNNATTKPHPELNAWSFWPHLAADGRTLVSGWDGPKTGLSYEVHFAVWSGPIAGKVDTTKWTSPTLYTGGDVSPIPLPTGGVVYARYAINPDENITSRLAIVARPGAAPTFLTAAADDCNAPAVSPDGTELAMICTSDTQSARLEVVPLVSGVPGPAKILVDNCLCTSPAFSPSGTDLLYYAPTDKTGHFELWWLKNATAAVPAVPLPITNHLDLDATSPPAWLAA